MNTLAQFLKSNGISQTALARKLGISPQLLRYYLQQQQDIADTALLSAAKSVLIELQSNISAYVYNSADRQPKKSARNAVKKIKKQNKS